jgi:hypothetical protein
MGKLWAQFHKPKQEEEEKKVHITANRTRDLPQNNFVCIAFSLRTVTIQPIQQHSKDAGKSCTTG